MRRLLVVIAILGLNLGTPPPAPAGNVPDRAICEAYCFFLALSCYLSGGVVMGSKKCDELYEGCIKGCVMAITEDNSGEQEK
jgi:hypothetical protein